MTWVYELEAFMVFVYFDLYLYMMKQCAGLLPSRIFFLRWNVGSVMG